MTAKNTQEMSMFTGSPLSLPETVLENPLSSACDTPAGCYHFP